MSVKRELTDALRYLLLPVPIGAEEECTKLTAKLLTDAKINEDDWADYVRLKFEEWRAGGNLDSVLKAIIGQVIILSDKERGKILAENYLRIHEGLRGNPLISFEIATLLLSQLRLIATLAANERMSSAKIALILKSIDTRLEIVTWREVQDVLGRISLLPEITQKEAEILFQVDEESEESYFADADMTDASFLVGQAAKNLKFSGDLEAMLNCLIDGDNTHIPYLQILHYQSLISGLYDHILSVPYEFSPRGNVANWLFDKWKTSTGNPILNNAKAVDSIDRNWANSRKANEYPQANALVDILSGIDGMGFVASQELTSWIRRWLVRYIKLNTTKPVHVKAKLKVDEIKKILEFIASVPTKTFGILEQRFVDVIASYLYPKSGGWRPRGVGDSINSNNISRRKLGDCDFQLAEKRTIIAFEAHGGTLTDIYYEGHIRTFKRILSLRAEELKGISELNEWKIKIIFVAYDFGMKVPRSFEINQIKTEIEFLKFKDLLKQVKLESEFEKSFKENFIESLNSLRTPQKIRDVVNKLI